MGYLGHMWELYAMWTWIPFMIRASLSQRKSDPALAEVASFLGDWLRVRRGVSLPA